MCVCSVWDLSMLMYDVYEWFLFLSNGVLSVRIIYQHLINCCAFKQIGCVVELRPAILCLLEYSVLTFIAPRLLLLFA